MVPMLFEVLFIIALVTPVLAVCVGLIVLLVPTRMKRTASVGRDEPAHAWTSFSVGGDSNFVDRMGGSR